MHIDDHFKEANEQFDVESIYKDIDKKRLKKLSPTDKRNIRAILLGFTPSHASEILGLKEDSLKSKFCEIYRDIEQLIEAQPFTVSGRDGSRKLSQAGYGLKTTVNEVSDISLSDSTTPKVIPEDLRQKILKKAKSIASAPCCCFFNGDWSVLLTKKAILSPLDIRVQVLICENEFGIHEVFAYEESGNNWTKNDCYSYKFNQVLIKSMNMANEVNPFASFFRTAITVYVFSDAPYGTGLHEDAAFALALSAALLMLTESNLSSHLEIFIPLILKFSGHILRFWYSQVSWVTILCSALCSPIKSQIMLCDRSNDDEVDFSKMILEEDNKEIARNLRLSPLDFDLKWIPFDCTKLSVYIYEPTSVDIDETTTRYKSSFLKLKALPMEYLFSEMEFALNQGNYEMVGMLMDLHQMKLNLSGFSSERYEIWLRKFRAINNVLGAKASCSRGKGAIIVLRNNHVTDEQFLYEDKSGGTVRVLLPMNKPTNGLNLGK